MYNDHKKIIRYTTLLILNLVVQTLYSQQDISFNQYMFGHQILNPAYSGSNHYTLLLFTYNYRGFCFPKPTKFLIRKKCLNFIC